MGTEPDTGPSTSGRPFRGWYKPPGYDDVTEKPIWLYNSLTDKKEKFVPKGGPSSKKIVWYSCGPTVYDSAHMGHSRNYMTIDILRRVLEDYFGYSILFVMNITDVDDKIVVKARRNYLLRRYQEEATDLYQVRQDTEAAVQSSLEKQQKSYNEAEGRHQDAINELQGQNGCGSQVQKKLVKQTNALEESAKGEEHKLKALKDIQASLPETSGQAQKQAEAGDLQGAIQHIMDLAGDQVALSLDEEQGATVTDEDIFRKHAQKYEREFWQDMDLLGTRKPTVLTRVTQYMQQIVEYIQQIVDGGFAYSSAQTLQNGKLENGNHAKENHSVYFDTTAFEAHKVAGSWDLYGYKFAQPICARKSGHLYPKLNPWAAGSSALASEGESNFATTEKRNPRDFALWKASKPGEPSWPSPWGKGRPGWHIECSAMASCIIGDKVDIHTGGQDLRFPHHDNELAQAEAYYHETCGCNGQWVNYFLHSGHLSIDGLKMSKSLKNFISIREALQDFTASQLRLMFAMQPWNKEMTFGKTMKEEMASKEHSFKHFFNHVEAELRKDTPVLQYQGLEADLEAKIEETRNVVDDSFRNNIDTATAVDALLKLTAATHKYMTQRDADRANSGASPHPYLLRESARFVTKILRILGISTAGLDDLGLGGMGLTATTEQLLDVYHSFRSSIADRQSDVVLDEVHGVEEDEAVLRVSPPATILDHIAALRDSIRSFAKKDTAKYRTVLEDCDRFRNKILVELGVRLEDLPDGTSMWSPEDPEILKAEERSRKKKAQEAGLKKKRAAIDDKKRILAKATTQSKLPTVLEALKEKYSRFTSEGQDANPSHDNQGNELKGSDLKKGKSAADKARKLRVYYDTQIREKGPNFLETLEEDIRNAEKAVEQEIRDAESAARQETKKVKKEQSGKCNGSY